MRVGDLVRLKGDDIRGSGRSGDWPTIPAGTVGIVVFSPHAEHYPARLHTGEDFKIDKLEVISESR